MSRKNRLIATIGATLLCALLLFAHAEGPDPWHTGAPGDDPNACTASGCHVGTPLNGGGGSVVVNFANGQTYTPGVQQTFTIVITDKQAKLYGFQMTARLESNLRAGQAGDFTAGTGQIVICSNHLDGTALFKGTNGCAASSPIQFIEHYLQPFSTNTITVKWTPPATDVGNIHIYVAANAANGNTLETGDHIYNANYVLTTQSGCKNSTPSVDTVQSAGAFNPKAGLAPGTWLEIYGNNLSCTSRGWAGSDFNGSNAPTMLDKVQVAINGKMAYVDYVSPLQVNVQAPDDTATGDGIQVVVSNDAGSSNAFVMHANKIAPALLAPPSFIVNGKQWVVAQFADQAFVGATGLIPGLNFRPAKVGDTIVIYGIGFGAVTPATSPGVIEGASNSLVTTPTFRFGQVAAKLSYNGLVPGFVGLYQFNVIVPTVTPGDIALNVDVGGTSLNQNLFVTVGQ